MNRTWLNLFSLKQHKLGRVTRASFAALISWAVFSCDSACQTQETNLENELRVQSNQGLALIKIRSNWLYLLSPGGALQSIANPRDFSNAWLSSDGKTIAWHVHNWPKRELTACPSPIIVETGAATESWQIPGNEINVWELAVSSDGRKVIFDGTYQPRGTLKAQNRNLWTTGLHYIDSKTSSPKLILPLSDADKVTSISLSPDNGRFVYDHDGRIFVSDVSSPSQRQIATGTSPTWSPDGKWITYKADNGQLVTLDATTYEQRNLFGQKEIEGSVRWSPDSEFIMFAEPLGPVSNLIHGRNPLLGPRAQMVIESVRDRSTVAVHFFEAEGIDDRGFYWVPDYRAFMRSASERPVIKACD